jgi:hypothetical protein
MGGPHPDYEVTALALQGGGALGSYQAGVYEGLTQAGIQPNWASVSSARKKCSDPRAQLRQELSFKPGIALQPWRIARRGMWQWDIARGVLPPRFGCFSQ